MATVVVKGLKPKQPQIASTNFMNRPSTFFHPKSHNVDHDYLLQLSQLPQN